MPHSHWILAIVAAASSLGASGMPRPSVAPPTAIGTAVHPAVSGAAGPYARVTVALTRAPGRPEGSFVGSARAPSGKSFPLPPPDEPADFFILQPRAVLFTPVRGGGPGNCVVILYDSSQVGPGHGTDHRALVYRLSTGRAVRLAAAEQRLEGARDAATARARLK